MLHPNWHRYLPNLSSALIIILTTTACAPTYRDIPADSIIKIDGEATPIIIDRQQVEVATMAQDIKHETDYRIGSGDVLYINISGKPEFMVATATTSSKVQGSRVDGSGRVTIPMAGQIRVGGLTLSEAQDKLCETLKVFLKDPWVVIEVAEYKSQPLYLLGAFKSPGTYYLDRPQNLLQGMSMGGGFDASANLRGARLSRAGQVKPVDIYALLNGGDQRQNVWLKPGDTIYLPDKSLQQVFVFGSVKKPGPVQIINGQLNLAQAVASAELREVGFDLGHIRIIRSLSPTRGELLVVDFDRMMRGKSLPFQLQDGDIVYVPRSQIGSWNDAISDILPSLQVISAILQPFVSIKYLNGN